MLIQIVLQIALGIAALLVVYLDYKWYDKRKAAFKNSRKYLIILMGLILILNIVNVVESENTHVEETIFLQERLNNLKDSLSSVIQVSNDLNNKLGPIIEMAKYRYPTLTVEEAVKKMEEDLESLEKKTEVLEVSEQVRQLSDESFYKLKRSKPQLDAKLEILENGDINILINFKNNVPIRFNPDLILEENGYGLVVKFYNKWPEIYPEKGRTYKFKYDDLKNLKYVQERAAVIKLKIEYESVYINEVKDQTLKGVIEKKYLLNIPQQTYREI
ncbi:MAG TPA: hypothetical protein VK169_00800 [Saprospiraceae bacterium]|nr:hypothetical protein [Saprospiraceae bacterium]